MSSPEQALASILSHLAFSFDGAVLGATLAYAAARSILKLTSNSAALRRIHLAPEVNVSDLRSLLPSPDDESQPSEVSKLVVLRGTVEARSTLLGKPSNVLVSHESGDKAVVVQRVQTYIYNEWKGLFGWTSDIRAVFGRSWRKEESISLSKVPFVLVEEGQPGQSEYVSVNLDTSWQPMPLTTVYRQLQPVNANPYTFLQALFGTEYPVGLLNEERILPLGKDITAVGIFSLKNGVLEIKSCKELPYFLSEMTKGQMIVDLAFRTKVLLWSSVVLGSLSIGILSYAFVRNWSRWNEWRGQRQAQQPRSPVPSDSGDSDIPSDEDISDVADGQLCVICLMRRRAPAFIPCGHIACCQSCALTIERELTPKCPVCRQSIRGSMRVFYA